MIAASTPAHLLRGVRPNAGKAIGLQFDPNLEHTDFLGRASRCEHVINEHVINEHVINNHVINEHVINVAARPRSGQTRSECCRDELFNVPASFETITKNRRARAAITPNWLLRSDRSFTCGDCGCRLHDVWVRPAIIPSRTPRRFCLKISPPRTCGALGPEGIGPRCPPGVDTYRA